MNEDERAELIAARHQSTVLNEGCWNLTGGPSMRRRPVRIRPRPRNRVHACGSGALAGADGEATAADGEPDDPAAGSDSMSRTGAARSARVTRCREALKL